MILKKSKRITTVDRRKKTEMSASVTRFCDQNLHEVPLVFFITGEPMFRCFNVNEHFCNTR